jgi:eukaryotic-like serine/threonine-protein kinase
MALETQGGLLAGRYRPLRILGTGGMARVHLAEDERLGRRVAVKQMHAHSADDAALRFEREAKLGASLNHPNLVSIYDIETEGESVLIVMEYVEGETLQDTIARGTPAPERVAEIVRDIASGLDHAHRHGVVHRDVKPANILIRRDGTAKLADLGIASAAEQTSITRSGVVMGTAAYMAPEQLEGGKAGPQTDVYALAAVAFEALSGQKARTGKTPLEVAHQVVNGPAPDLARSWHGAPPGVVSALARGLAREPGERHSTAGAFADELTRGLRARVAQAAPATERTAPMPVTARHAPERPARRNWIPAAAIVVLLALAAVLGAGLLDGGDDPDPARDAVSNRQTPAPGSSGEKADRRTAAEGRDGAPVAPPSADAPAEQPAASEPAGDDPVELNDQGYALMQAGDYDSAIPLLERAVAAYPEGSQELTYAYALYNLGRSLRLAGRPDEAIPILERRLEIPNQTETVQRELDAARAEAG